MTSTRRRADDCYAIVYVIGPRHCSTLQWLLHVWNAQNTRQEDRPETADSCCSVAEPLLRLGRNFFIKNQLHKRDCSRNRIAMINNEIIVTRTRDIKSNGSITVNDPRSDDFRVSSRFELSLMHVRTVVHVTNVTLRDTLKFLRIRET